ncbi:multidrug transporter [Pontibacter pamirensis]|uniref:multidrug transporter n=1 Tax=Pontibacter pamirensis TaxID=2562824 RepID=UPI00138A20E1|nr:multidrug transporter [Pontibacter pamirensis]
MKLLLFIALSLLVGHVVVVHLAFKALGVFSQSSNLPIFEEIYYALYNQFHLGKEGNISTYFSTFNLALASILCYVIHSTGKKATYHWLHLSLLFVFLSVDESAQLHETFGGLAGSEFNSYLEEVPPLLSWAWMVPYTVFTLLIGLYFLKFTLMLPGKTRNLFYLSGAIFVFAALGLEFCEAHFDTLYGPDNVVNQFLFPIEELLEMVGVIIFNYALLDYLMLNKKVLQFSFKDRK